MSVFLILISMIIIDKSVGDKLLQPKKKCVPSATIQGPCYVCVCHTDGVYHCRRETCHQELETSNKITRECEPNELYREETTFCACSPTGQWRSSNCREKFQRLPLKQDPIKKNLRTNIACRPNSLYVVDCNICLCTDIGIIDFRSCTSRSCPKRNKGDYCNRGEVYRSNNEFCICSNLNYYIDQLCLKVVDEVIHPVHTDSIAEILELAERFKNIDEEKCEQGETFSKDCNTCTCQDSRYVCTSKVCFDDKAGLRAGSKPLQIPELKSLNEKCIPGKKYKLKCNTCVCNNNGEPLCNSTKESECSAEKSNVTQFSNVTLRARTKTEPAIKEGDSCTPGVSYKIDCNRCHCSDKKTLICTKMACFDWSNVINHKHAKREGHKLVQATKSNLPELPSGKCVPGKIYRKKCNRCFCSNLGKASCSSNRNGACSFTKDGKPKPIHSPYDLRPTFKRKELKVLPSLASASQKCEPGKSYKVSCNICVCTDKNNLICTKSLCLSFDDVNRVEAQERSGLPCSGKTLTNESCISCKCVNQKTECKKVENCIIETRTRLSKGSKDTLKMQIDPMKDKCVPGAIYTDNCNRCYCQPDTSLRCTQKTCLNYAQSKLLDEQFKRLEREGL